MGGISGCGSNFPGNPLSNTPHLNRQQNDFESLRQKVSLNLGHTSREVEAFRNLFSKWNNNQIKYFSTLISPNSGFSNLISQVGTEANGDEGLRISHTTGNVSELKSESDNQVVQMAVGRMFRQLLGAVPVFLLLKQHPPSRLEASSLFTSQLFSSFVGSVKSGMDAALSNQLSDTTKKQIDLVTPELNYPILTKILGATGAAVALQPLTTIISKLATDPLPR